MHFTSSLAQLAFLVTGKEKRLSEVLDEAIEIVWGILKWSNRNSKTTKTYSNKIVTSEDPVSVAENLFFYFRGQ